MGYGIVAAAILSMVVLHEIGHFIAAKVNGVTVLEFGIGMGPVVFKIQGKETLYSVRLLPIGGFVAMFDGETPKDLDKWSQSRKEWYSSLEEWRRYESKKWWQKASIVAAGPVMNILSALVLMVVLLLPNAANFEYFSVKEEVSVAETQFQPGDRIVEINGYPVISAWDAMYFYFTTLDNPEEIRADITVKRGGSTIELNGVLVQEYLQVGKVIVSENSIGKSVMSAGKYLASFTVNTVAAFRELFTGGIGPEAVGGPVGIVAVTGPAIEETVKNKMPLDTWIMLGAYVSMSLGLMNLLPIPALDGGHLIFIGIEAVRGRPLNGRVRTALEVTMFVVLIGVSIVLICWDVIGITTGRFKFEV